MVYQPQLSPSNGRTSCARPSLPCKSGEVGEESGGDILTPAFSNNYAPAETSPNSPTSPTSPLLLGREAYAQYFSPPAPSRRHANGADSYAKRIQAALRQINRPDYPVGMIAWLETAYPGLYGELTQRLPDDLHKLHEARAPVERFDEILKRLVETHEHACALFRGHLFATHNGQPPKRKTAEGQP